MRRKTGFLMLFLVLGAFPSATAQTAVPYPNAATPKAIDLGALKAQSGATPISVTIALRLPALKEAEALLQSLHTPGDPQFHKFLSANQFVARFAPTDADVAKVVAALAKYGLAAERTTATTLNVTGLPADMENAFAVSLHSYQVPEHENVPGYTFHAPLSQPTIPAEISASVAAVVGLDSRPSFRPLSQVVSQKQAVAYSSVTPATTGDAPGSYTVTDFANFYDVQPLYRQGVTGSGRTIGIVGLASFTPSDAFDYWKALGLKVAPDRLRIVNIDGGPGAPSDASGSLETAVDVEQSGGIAPGARIILYQAPNTFQAFLDAFAAAVDSNAADTVATSWGNWEWFYNFENGPVTDPTTGRTVGFAQALHELLVRAAMQGETFFAASGDGGAYDVNADLGCFPSTNPSCSITLSVDYPGSDSAITSAGGTTLPVQLELCENQACTPPYYDINIPRERVGGWDYLAGFCEAVLGQNPIACGIFPAGSGGGVSIMFSEPSYQFGLPGIERSQPGQYFVYEGQLLFALPPYYPGRNVPDVSFNADPETGYVVYYTSSVSGFGIEPGWGGTSFASQQLNGVSALLGEYLQSRIGLLNYPLYDLALSGQAYGGAGAPLHAIAYGDNWFYQGSNGYNPAVGLGTMEVANFAQSLRGVF